MNTITLDVRLASTKIDRNIYGHFSEHLGRCIYEGYWVGEDSPIPNVRGIRKDVVAARSGRSLAARSGPPSRAAFPRGVRPGCVRETPNPRVRASRRLTAQDAVPSGVAGVVRMARRGVPRAARRDVLGARRHLRRADGERAGPRRLRERGVTPAICGAKGVVLGQAAAGARTLVSKRPGSACGRGRRSYRARRGGEGR